MQEITGYIKEKKQSFIWTMWNVNFLDFLQDVDVEMFYLNYVECK